MRAASIVIVGGGIAGLATAWSLARRGARGIVLVERERDLATHSTALNAAILRTPMPDPLIEALAREGADLLRAPPSGFSPIALVDMCGLVIASPRRDGDLAEWERRLDRRPDAERLSPARFAALAPHFVLEAESAWWLPLEGRIDNAALVRAFARGAREHGVRIESGTGVRELLQRDHSVRGIRLDDGTQIEAQRTVLAAGGWAARLGAAAGSRVRLRPTRRHLLVTAPDARIDPRWPIVWTDAGPFYARPEAGGLMMCACDQVDVDPDALAALPEERAAIERRAARFLPGLGRLPAARFWAGVRTLSADDRFVIGPDPDLWGLDWVAGLGGHGMTCAFSIGRLAAASILDSLGDGQGSGAAHGAGASDAAILAALDPARLVVRDAAARTARDA